MTGLNVYQRMAKVCEIIGAQAWVKDLANSQYKSIPIDAMRNGVRSACVQAGLVHVGPVDIDYTITKEDRTYRYLGTCRFVYINIDNPEERIEFESIGEAMDNGDKGVGKFVTNLIKNHYKAAFDIGEQNEDDLDNYSNDDFEDKAKKPAQQDRLFKTAAKPAEARTPEKQISVERARLLKKLSDIILEGGNDGEIINKMVADFKKSSLDYCKTEELHDILNTVRPFDNYDKGAKQ